MQLLRSKAVAAKFSTSENTIWRWSRETDFPKPFKVNGLTVWDENELNNWLTSKKEMSNGSRSETESGHIPADV